MDGMLSMGIELSRGRDRKIDRFVGRGFPSPRYDTFGLAVAWFTEDQTREPQSVQGGQASVQRFYSKALAGGTKQTRKTSRCSIIPRQDVGEPSGRLVVGENNRKNAAFNNLKR
ncbi:hypothetical protein PspLS_03429 [Pyricularia sp. CBS 133598]|nr:hypothetical protein PspLS_03429 [Pyricularia sp. CBS 133598]